ncbi:hypothetical protein M378DRAFT_162244 [Amanita muscaria Koide BX008]|uniref:Uncharacterized protein n=1 Tax=Amanita muscaria (strain Koide BX008) TaxID=946122 RepID=A0A0C2WU62_AMAMK|nr:hypothetical protein M378DRAFT_162244 [Amanita muscaria Koide BX008]
MKVSVYKSSSTSRRLTNPPANTGAPFFPSLTNVGPVNFATAINGIVMVSSSSIGRSCQGYRTCPHCFGTYDSSHSNNQFGSKYLVSGASDTLRR